MNSPKQRILIVDDSPSIIQYICTILHAEGLVFNVADSGVNAFAALKEYRPDLILLDINLPDMNGFQIIERIKGMPEYADIPIIFLSSNTEPEDKVRGFKSGAVDYITKPIPSREELLARIRTHLSISSLNQRLRISNLELEKRVEARTQDLYRKNRDLEHLKDRYRDLVESINDCIWEVDEHMIFTYVSPQFLTQTGMSASEQIGKSLSVLFDDFDMENSFLRIKEAWASHKPFDHVEHTIIHDNGRRIILETDGYPVFGPEGQFHGFRGLSRDITEHKMFKEAMIQNEKMIALGGIASGMAHEINNPLAVIIQGNQNIRNRLLSDTDKNRSAAADIGTNPEAIFAYVKAREVDRIISHLEEAGSRIKGIIKNMLSFAKKDLKVKTECSVTAIMDKTMELLFRDLVALKKMNLENLKVDRDYQDDLPHACCEPGKIQQVFFNILKNAIEAMNDKAGDRYIPELKISISSDRERIIIEIRDNGPGIPMKIRNRLFEPFFTTKGNDMGTGLGLSVSHYIIVEDHKGTFEVESSENEWTLFKITFPQYCDY